MADFCGLTRVKTWRWSRLFACAVAVLCAISPISAFPDTCPSVSVTCNPGFYNSGGACTKCASGKYNAKSGATSCINCPANTISNGCPEYTVGDFNYGRPGIICKAGYYRAYDVDTNNGTIKGLKCTQCPTGLNKQADSGIGLVDFSAGEPVPVSNGVVQITNISSGADQCNLCASGWYQKGYYQNATSSYTGANRCAKCPSHVKNGGCHQNGEIYCDAGYYRYLNDDGTVTCQACPNNTTKDADEDGSTDVDLRTCNRCVSGAYYYITTYAACNECPEHSVKDSNGNCNTEAMNAGAIADGHNDIRCEAGHYRHTDSAGDVVTCEPCPDGYTTAYDTMGPAKEQTQYSACIYCEGGYFRVPYELYSGVPVRARDMGSCFKCPVTSGGSKPTGVKECGNAPYSQHKNEYGYNLGERYYLTCEAGYYSVMENGQYICKKCTGGATSLANEYAYPNELTDYFYDSDDDIGFWEIDDNYEWSNTSYDSTVLSPSWLEYLHESTPFPSGTDSCDVCKGGYFEFDSNGASVTNCYKCPENTVETGTKCSRGKVNCKANYYLKDNGGNPSAGDSYYNNRFSCNACPTFTGKLKDSNHSVETVGEQQCNICTNGYYGSSVREESNFSVNNCKRCPQFTVLGSLGICIRGHTDEPTNTTDDIINGDATACYIPEGTSSGSTGDGIQATPLFRDTMGVFLISRDNNVNKQCQIPNTSPYARSGTCTLKSGTKCVYVDTVPTGKRATCIDAVVNAVKSIYPCRKNTSCTDEEKKNLITKTTAADVVAHAGMENPWFCCDPSKENAECDTKIASFKNALTSGSCVVNSSDIKDCEVGTDANCAKGDGT